jgi:hypothetical protein
MSKSYQPSPEDILGETVYEGVLDYLEENCGDKGIEQPVVCHALASALAYVMRETDDKLGTDPEHYGSELTEPLGDAFAKALDKLGWMIVVQPGETGKLRWPCMWSPDCPSWAEPIGRPERERLNGSGSPE